MAELPSGLVPLPSDAYAIGHSEGGLMACDAILYRHGHRHESWRESIRQVRGLTQQELDRLMERISDEYGVDEH